MDTKKEGLIGIVGPAFVTDEPDVLSSFSKDESFVLSIAPAYVVRPGSGDEVQRLVKWANETATPLVPVSSAAPHFYGDTVPSAPGAVIVDLSRMNRILRIDRRNRMAVIEPGVTYEQLQAALAKEGMRLSTPLLPKQNKSVIASLLERQPTMITRYQYSLIEPLRNCGVVWGNGELSYTGEAGMSSLSLEEQWAAGERQEDPKGPAQTDFVRLLAGSQGSLGIVIWASVRLGLLPTAYKVEYMTANKFEDLVEATYWLARVRLGDELFIANNTQLANMMTADSARVARLKESLPRWVLVVGMGGRDLLPEEKVAAQAADLRDVAQRYGLKVVTGLPGVNSEEMVNILRNPSRNPYWKLNAKGGNCDIFFLTKLDNAPRFVEIAMSTAEAHKYPLSDVGVYFQPQHQGAAYHCEFSLPFNPNDKTESTRIKELYAKASEALISQGAYLSRPYGQWAKLMYDRDAQSTMALRKIKHVFDPNGVMNPGKLCF